MNDSATSFLFSDSIHDLELQPFAHADRRNAADPNFYSELSDTFPLDQFGNALDSDHQVHRLSSKQLLDNPATKPSWREFIKRLTSDAFWQEIVSAFGGEIRSRHGHLEQIVGKPLDAWRVSKRGEPAGDIVIEAL